LIEAATSVHRRFLGSPQASKALDRTLTLHSLGIDANGRKSAFALRQLTVANRRFGSKPEFTASQH
jgi:hypothetical protein